jgi:LPXTG-motif cell wall-anchored protein
VGYEYIPRTQDNAYTLFGYQAGETAFPSDIERFSGKTFRSWNTLVYRELVEWENVGGRIVSQTDGNGNIIWKVPNVGGYHTITYDMTLNKNEVIRFTNLPTGTQYTIQEIYANHYQADNSSDSAGHVPIGKASNIAEEGYEIKQVLTTNGTVSQTAIAKDTVSGTIDTPNVRYYNQFTNELKSVKTQITILKMNQDGSSPLPGAVFDLYDEAGYQANPKVPLKTGLVSSSEEGKEGTIDLGELTDGVYYLVETAAPAGYNKLTEPVTITVSQGGVTYNQENSTLDSDGGGTQGTYETGYQLTVVNDEGAVLPHTGGPGTKALYLFGVTLICLAGAGFVMKRRRTHRA